MKRFIFAIFLLIVVNFAYAQDEGLRFINYIYKPNIHTVQFHLDGLPLSYPIIELNSEAQLLLSFDDLDGDAKNYTYSIVHCNMYWEPSNLAEMEYVNGFIEERIEYFQFSFNALPVYTNYRLPLPNERMSFTKSGNYLLKVYDNEGRKSLALTRRFVVVEPLVSIAPRLVRPNIAGKLQTHQEIDFTINHQRLKISRPMQEIRAVILQNGRWDNAVTDLPPFLFRTDELVFDYQDRVIFPAGKEFRPLDIRSMRFRGQGIARIEQTDETYEITLAKERSRRDDSYFERIDADGGFVIENMDRITPNADSIDRQRSSRGYKNLASLDPNLTGNYANVLFQLQTPEPYYDDEVYVFGALTDWQLKPEFKMAYNNTVNGYVAKAQLKQGYYDYAYVTVPRNSKIKNPQPTFDQIEGNWFETNNQYTILIYYRAFGERYDRAIGAATFSSRF